MTLCDQCEHFLDMIFDKPKCMEKDETIYRKKKRYCEDFCSFYLDEEAKK